MDKKQIRKKLWDSLEMHHYRVNLAIVFLCFCIAFFPFVGRSASGGIMALLVFLPFMVFYIYRMIQILCQPEEYVFTCCKLENFHFSPFWRTACFSVRLDLPEVGIVNDETAAIFLPMAQAAQYWKIM